MSRGLSVSVHFIRIFIAYRDTPNDEVRLMVTHSQYSFLKVLTLVTNDMHQFIIIENKIAVCK